MYPSLSGFPLRPSRVHEVCGAGATTFAAICAAQGSGPVLWVRPAWSVEILNPQGLCRFFDPARLLLAQAPSHEDALAVTEEALRDGSVPLVITEITRPLDLRQGRRLQLAAKAGNTTGLCLIPEGMGSNAAETRWRVSPCAAPLSMDSTRMRWEIIKNKSGTPKNWEVLWDDTANRLHVVSPARVGSGSSGAPG
ncbi:hypothetical protein Q4543_08450 [Salipiger sp. 1_MG-2023]|uniref:ImuA family protein n=1 Tax=Salipiger sp. 1_MG-2023 TaxID=3062665 RepID=UPI0026E1E782|nr:hypothetical protein [Salipiger sp. 1_MG-2023]MDO6585547.1 hypothetical protein [Salipiger sp. 1_MG-2023]